MHLDATLELAGGVRNGVALDALVVTETHLTAEEGSGHVARLLAEGWQRTRRGTARGAGCVLPVSG